MIDELPFEPRLIGNRESEISNRSEEHTSELQSQSNLVCRLLLEKKKHQAHHLSSPQHAADQQYGSDPVAVQLTATHVDLAVTLSPATPPDDQPRTILRATHTAHH